MQKNLMIILNLTKQYAIEQQGSAHLPSGNCLHSHFDIETATGAPACHAQLVHERHVANIEHKLFSDTRFVRPLTHPAKTERLEMITKGKPGYKIWRSPLEQLNLAVAASLGHAGGT